jgi:hypothetical protein
MRDEPKDGKTIRRDARRARVKIREARWIRQYEANMAGCLNDPYYHLPTAKELHDAARSRHRF